SPAGSADRASVPSRPHLLALGQPRLDLGVLVAAQPDRDRTLLVPPAGPDGHGAGTALDLVYRRGRDRQHRGGPGRGHRHARALPEKQIRGYGIESDQYTVTYQPPRDGTGRGDLGDLARVRLGAVGQRNGGRLPDGQVS